MTAAAYQALLAAVEREVYPTVAALLRELYAAKPKPAGVRA